MLMLVVVPAEEELEPATRVQHAREDARVVGLVLERLELRLAEGVVVGHVGSTEAMVDAERGQQLRQRVALHRGAAVGVHDEAGLDAVAGDGLGEELGRRCLHSFAATIQPTT